MKTYEHIKKTQLQNNIKLLRNTYKMTCSDVSHMENNIRRPTLQSWEQATRIPTCDNLLVYAITFGISIDWLYGISKTPYTLQSIDCAEKTYYKSIKNAWNTDTINTKLFDDSISKIKFIQNSLENYCNHTIRKNKYSPEARANILVLYKFSTSIAMNFQKKNKKYKQIIEDMISIINTTHPIYSIK